MFKCIQRGKELLTVHGGCTDRVYEVVLNGLLVLTKPQIIRSLTNI